MLTKSNYPLQDIRIHKRSPSMESVLPKEILHKIVQMLTLRDQRIVLLVSTKWFILVENPEFLLSTDKILCIRRLELRKIHLQSEIATLSKAYLSLKLNRLGKQFVWVAAISPVLMVGFEMLQRSYPKIREYATNRIELCKEILHLQVNNTTCLEDRFGQMFHDAEMNAECRLSYESWQLAKAFSTPSLSKRCQALLVNYLSNESLANLNFVLVFVTTLLVASGIIFLGIVLFRSRHLNQYSPDVLNQLTSLSPFLPKITEVITDKKAIDLMHESQTAKKKALQGSKVQYNLLEKQILFFRPFVKNNPANRRDEELQPLLKAAE